jgi:DNA-binding GntR family transcriptional regulator
LPPTKHVSTWTVEATLDRAAAPLRAQATETLRRAILSMALKEGDRLIERELIDRLKVSRTTVREALRELEAEGLVEVIPQRGSVVATISESDAADLYTARTALEALIVRRFIERAEDPLVDELVEAVDGFGEVAVDGREVVDMLQAKDRFYDVLRRGADSPALWQVLSGLQARVRVLRARSLAVPGRPPASAAELRALVAAIRDRDADRAAELCAVHVRAAAATGLPALSQARRAG